MKLLLAPRPLDQADDVLVFVANWSVEIDFCCCLSRLWPWLIKSVNDVWDPSAFILIEGWDGYWISREAAYWFFLHEDLKTDFLVVKSGFVFIGVWC